MNIDPTEYSKTGGDASTASATEDTAFSRDKTRPEEQLKSADKESGSKVRAGHRIISQNLPRV
jgi:hypothetical protein